MTNHGIGSSAESLGLQSMSWVHLDPFFQPSNEIRFPSPAIPGMLASTETIRIP